MNPVSWWPQRTQAWLITAAALLAQACGGPTNSDPRGLAVPPVSTIPTSTASAPTYILGMEPADISLNLKNRQFRCDPEKEVQASPAAPLVRFHSSRCTSADQFFLYDVTYVTEDRQRVRLITAALTPTATMSEPTARSAAGTFLGFIATLPYANARPTEAQEWVKANVGSPGARTTIASAMFEIDPASGKGSPPTYRINIVATGIAPTAAATASPSTSEPQGAPARTTPPSSAPPAAESAQAAVAASATARPVASPARVVVATQTTFCSPGRTTGTVRNDGGTAARLVTVSARIFLSDGRLWTTAEGLTSPATVAAGSTGSFEVAYQNPQICLAGARGDVSVRWDSGTSEPVPLAR